MRLSTLRLNSNATGFHTVPNPWELAECVKGRGDACVPSGAGLAEQRHDEARGASDAVDSRAQTVQDYEDNEENFTGAGDMEKEESHGVVTAEDAAKDASSPQAGFRKGSLGCLQSSDGTKVATCPSRGLRPIIVQLSPRTPPRVQTLERNQVDDDRMTVKLQCEWEVSPGTRTRDVCILC